MKAKINLLIFLLCSLGVGSAFSQPTNKPTTLTALWDPSPDPTVAYYQLFWGTNSGIYKSSKNVTNTSTVVSNIYPNQFYYFRVRGMGPSNIPGHFGDEVIWPYPQTNYVVFSVYTRTNLNSPRSLLYSVVLTNPPYAAMFFESELAVTNNYTKVVRLSSESARTTLSITNVSKP